MAAAIPLVASAATQLSPDEVREWLQRAEDRTARIRDELRDQFDLGPDGDGWYVLAGLLIEFYYIDVLPTVRGAEAFFKAWLGVAEALYSWLGATGTAIERGAGAIASGVENGVITAGKDVYNFFTHL